MRIFSEPAGPKIISVILVLVAFLLIDKCSKGDSPDKWDKKLTEVEAMYAQLPLYHDFQKVSDGGSAKPTSVAVFKYYKSGGRYDDVKAFYSKELTAVGWRLSSEVGVKDWWRDFGGRKL